MQVESKMGSVVYSHVYEDGEQANPCMDNGQDGSVFSLPFLHPFVLLCPSAAEGLSERSSREVQGRLQSTAFVCTGLCGKMRWCSADMALDPARKQTKQMY